MRGIRVPCNRPLLCPGASGASKRLKKKAGEQGAPLPLFIAPGQLKQFIDNELLSGPLKVVAGSVSNAFPT